MFASKDLFFSKPSGYQISRSVRTRASASAYFGRTPSSTTNRQTWTWSSWIKRGALSGGARQGIFSVGGVSASDLFRFGFDTNDCLFFNDTQASATVLTFTTTPLYRDPSAWYHVVLAIDTTQSTSTNRVKLYVNGVQVTAFASSTYPTQNVNTYVNTAVVSDIGRMYNPPTAAYVYLDGYLTEINFIDGQALTPSSFGQTNTITGVWQPLKYTGTYGTNGFYLNFSDNSNNTAATIGKDYSGNGNNWTPNNISVTAGVTYDSMLDVPTLYADGGNGRGNYCVMNPLNPDTISLNGSLTNGNLNASGTTYGVSVFSCTFQVPQSGKWYWETVYTTITNTVIVGIRSYSTSSTDVRYYSNGNKEVGGSTTAYGSSWTTNDVIGVAVDRDAGTVTFYKNNTSQGSINIPTNSAQFDITFNTTSPFGSTAMSVNFGQRPFSYTPPSGYVALNTQNLPTPTISNGANYMAATTYTGTGSAASISNAVNGVSFQPDWVWIKSRSNVTNNNLTDSVRGVTKLLFSNSNAAEATFSGGLSSFDSGGFSLASGGDTGFSANGYTYVGWQWKAGVSAVTNTDGSITSTVDAGATQGFSVVTFVNASGTNQATVGHGLGVAPRLIIAKNRDTSANNWAVFHASVCDTTSKFLRLNTTDAITTFSTVWGAALPTSTVFGVTGTGLSAPSVNMVAYCFSEVAGYSKFGSYTGNGSSDGPFVFCGFRPRWVMIKCSSTGGAGFEWELVDTSRNTSNVTNLVLYPNLSDAEATASTAILDITSNGFKLRGAANIINASSATYIFAAFAENPFKNSLAR